MADVKNYGLKGVGSTVQYGKAGGNIKWENSAFNVVAADGSTPVTVRGANGVAADDFVTIAQLDAAATGINVKGAVITATSSAIIGVDSGDGACTWQGAITFAGATPTAAEVGTFAFAPKTISGVVLQAADRVLVRFEGVTGLESGSPVVGTGAQANGIYTVTAVGTNSVTLVRSTDAGGDLTADTDAAAAYLRNNNQFVYGDYTFVTDGTNAGDAYLLSNYLNISESDPGKEPDLNDDAGNGYAVFLTFTQAPVYLADNGVQLNGQTFSSNIDSLPTGTSNTTTTTIAIGDGTGGGTDERTTLHNVFIDNNVPHDLPAFASAGFVTRTGSDEYKTVVPSASTLAGEEGVVINENFSGSTVDWGLDITGLTNTAQTGISEIVLYDGTNNSKRSLTNVFADLDVVTTNGVTSGILVKTADDAYVGRTITVAADGTGTGGLAVTNGDGVSANPELGLNIIGTTLGVNGALADSLIVYSDTDTVNRRMTIQTIADLAAAGVSDNEIVQGDSSIVVTDVGTGTITTTVDSTVVATTTVSGMDVTSLSVDDLTDTRVVFAGTDGELVDDAEFTYNSTTNALSVGGDISAGSLTTTVGGVASNTTVTANGDITTATGNIAASAGSVTGLTVVGTNGVSTGAAGSATVGTGGATIGDLTVAGGMVYTDVSGKLQNEAAFTYDDSTNTLTVDNLNVTGTGAMSVSENEIAFGDATGGVVSDTAFTVDATNKILTIGNLELDGEATTQAINGTEVNGDISIVPNGTGEVIIGAAGDGVISSDTGSTLTLDGDTGLVLTSTNSDVTIQNGSTDVASFVANASADTSLVFSSDTVANAPSIGTSQDADIKFVLGASNLVIVSDNAAYDIALASNGGDALTTKSYVDTAIATGAAAESVKTVYGTVDLATDGSTDLNVAGGTTIPAGAIVLSVKVVTTLADSAATLSIGDSTTAARYMATTENDPSDTTTIYMTENFTADAGAVQLTATVASTAGDAGASANVIVEYRVPSA